MTDPRQLRTRESLREALRLLLLQHGLDDVSVALLCRAAGVHRTTFYSHAQSVRSFAIAEFADDIDRLSTVPVDAEIETPATVAYRYLASLRQVLGHISDERTIYEALFSSDAGGAFCSALESRLRGRAQLALSVFATQHVEGAPTGEYEREEAAAFIAGALVSAIRAWTISNQTDAAAASARIFRLMPAWWPGDK